MANLTHQLNITNIHGVTKAIGWGTEEELKDELPEAIQEHGVGIYTILAQGEVIHKVTVPVESPLLK